MVLRSRGSRIAVGTAAAGLAVAGLLVVREVNSPTFAVEAAPRGDDPECARIAKGYPPSLSGQERSRTDVAGAAAWGDGGVVLRCGLRPPDPTVDPCVTVDDVDWVLREAKWGEGRKVLITYGRNPAVEVSISDKLPHVDQALVELSRVVQPIRQRDKCVTSGR